MNALSLSAGARSGARVAHDLLGFSAMAYFAPTDFLQDELFLDGMRRLHAGELTLDWMEVPTERVRCRVRDPRRGLTYSDIDVGTYSTENIPEIVRHQRTMAPRGAYLPPGLPDMGYVVNRKSEVWADNVLTLYEEAKSRQWNAATDIDWSLLDAHPAPTNLEKAFAQLCTFLSEVEMIATDLPARWISLINHDFVELTTQFQLKAIEEYFRRLERTGLEGRRERSKFTRLLELLA